MRFLRLLAIAFVFLALILVDLVAIASIIAIAIWILQHLS